jgi:hypothetical protein
VAFYVPLGPRGLLIQLGTFVISIWGGLAYGLAHRRRANFLNNRVHSRNGGLPVGMSIPFEHTPLLLENTAEQRSTINAMYVQLED